MADTCGQLETCGLPCPADFEPRDDLVKVYGVSDMHMSRCDLELGLTFAVLCGHSFLVLGQLVCWADWVLLLGRSIQEHNFAFPHRQIEMSRLDGGNAPSSSICTINCEAN